MLGNETGIDPRTERRQEPPRHLDQMGGAGEKSRGKARKVGLWMNSPPVEIHWQPRKVRQVYC